MGVKKARQAAAENVREEKMGGFDRVIIADMAADPAADLFQRAADPVRVAGKLYRRGVGEKFTLPRDGRTDNVGEKLADQTDDQKGNADSQNQKKDRHRGRVFVVVTASGRAGKMRSEPYQDVTDDRDHFEPEKHADQLHV